MTLPSVLTLQGRGQIGADIRTDSSWSRCKRWVTLLRFFFGCGIFLNSKPTSGRCAMVLSGTLCLCEGYDAWNNTTHGRPTSQPANGIRQFRVETRGNCLKIMNHFVLVLFANGC